ncbi:glycoside hydrolase [Coccomyxa subellipsoidea C-169]|uniref:Glycoside hydrolase n=1 Tax=Coccomyxa subellipsoidea (strain C-169) TaxID=574566 RepID=I0YXB6_COCSC|nr:glycoside hydrolase [Coccomyxa subellipsoidea C-169]EIE23035.1 glycoside hydrolase [Coccomyxa subellipsoidea C-169]|eukprot:XP_005647579.1 glycoside hydrolase [Coccomyxa subellipsoidea C-169]
MVIFGIRRPALLVFVAAGAASGLLLTTNNGVIYDGDGNVVKFRGIGWFGFNSAFSYPEGLWMGKDSVTQDFATNVWRMKQLGFNAIRLPFRFTDFEVDPIPVKHECQVAPALNLKYTMVPDSFPNLPRSSLDLPAEAPPAVPGSICSAQFLDTLPVYDRYLMVIKFYVDQGFYVNIDYHTTDPDYRLKDFNSFISNWTTLVTRVLTEIPEAKGRIVLDLINEPDGHKMTWQGSGNIGGLADYYIALMDALWPICPDCLFLGEGTGAAMVGANYGDGYVIDQSVVRNSGASDATPFFNRLVKKAYASQFMAAPHIYCGEVTGQTYGTSGKPLYNKLTMTFGHLTLSPGFCPTDGGACRVFGAVVDEFGSMFNSADEQTCFRSIVAYMNNELEAADGQHAMIENWFYWSWQPDSYGTGGILADDYRQLQWFKVNALTGGTSYMSTGLGLRPWYLADFSPLPELGTAPPPAAAPSNSPFPDFPPAGAHLLNPP